MFERGAGFQTGRQVVTAGYEKYAKENGVPYHVASFPYHSTQSLRFDVVDTDTASQVGFAVARAGQKMQFFSYGVGQPVILGGLQRPSTEADTNLGKARSTNGAADFVIEGAGFSHRCHRPVMPAGYFTPPLTDPSARNALTGQTPMFDPSAIIVPPQHMSPFMLEQGDFQALLGLMSLQFQFDRKAMEPLGIVDLLPQAGAKSLLRANGEPESANRYKIPEGFIWRRQGEPGSDLVVIVALEEDVVIPITFGTPPFGQNAGTPTPPVAVHVDMVLRLYGPEFSILSGN
jgi:hypothetical protein